MKEMKKKNFINAYLLICLILSCGCMDENDTVEESYSDSLSQPYVEDIPQTDSYDYQEDIDSNIGNQDLDSIQENVEQISIAGNKCIGCGKCVRTAGENFSLSNGKAIVISQDNIDSNEVLKAVNNCPVKAISIG